MYKVWRRGGGGAVLANKPPKHQFSTSLWQYCPVWTNLRDWEVGAAALANQPPKPPFFTSLCHHCRLCTKLGEWRAAALANQPPKLQ